MSVRTDNCNLCLCAFVAPVENSHFVAPSHELMSQPQDDRGFSCAAHSEISHADDGYGRMMHGQPAMIVQPVAPAHDGRESPSRWSQQKPADFSQDALAAPDDIEAAL